MLFSEKFDIEQKNINEYGASDLSLVSDLPLFVDPMLIFNSQKKEYQKLHKDIIKYFHFLAQKANKGLTPSEIKTWFSFNEVCQNWLGYSLYGNKGQGSAEKFANFLYENIPFALNNNNISKGIHAEKVSLLYKGNGKDKISDMIVNLIKGYLCGYTEKFTKQYLNKVQYKEFSVEKSGFNYITESFESKTYLLPYITYENGVEEYIILTPLDILRKEEQTINRNDFFKRNKQVRNSIDNDVLKTQVENYISKAVGEYEKEQKGKNKKSEEKQIDKLELKAFYEMVVKHPEICDYYIKMVENEKDIITEICKNEVEEQQNKFIVQAKKLKDIVIKDYDISKRKNLNTAKEITIYAIKHLKHCIENCDGYRNLYNGEKRISTEDDLRRLLRLVWHDMNDYSLDFDTNNGRGEIDTITSKGDLDKCITEFKLASNPKLINVLEQLSVYNNANKVKKENNLIVIFYFSEDEYTSTVKTLNSLKIYDKINKSVFLVDCRKDNKTSASNVKRKKEN